MKCYRLTVTHSPCSVQKGRKWQASQEGKREFESGKREEDRNTKLSVTSALKQFLHAQIGMKPMTKMQQRSSD